MWKAYLAVCFGHLQEQVLGWHFSNCSFLSPNPTKHNSTKTHFFSTKFLVGNFFSEVVKHPLFSFRDGRNLPPVGLRVVVVVLRVTVVVDGRHDRRLHLLVVDLLPVDRLEPSVPLHVVWTEIDRTVCVKQIIRTRVKDYYSLFDLLVPSPYSYNTFTLRWRCLN